MQKLLLVQSTINWNSYLKILGGATFFKCASQFCISNNDKSIYYIHFCLFLETTTLFKSYFYINHHNTLYIQVKKKKESRTGLDSDQLPVTNIFEIGIFLMNRKQPENRKLLSSLVSSDWKTFKWFRLTYAWPSSCSRLGLWCQLSSSWSGVLNWQD